MLRKQNGLSTVELIIVMLVLLVLAGVGWFVFNRAPKNDSAAKQAASTPAQDSGELKIKSIGFNLGYYDPATKRAGDFLFADLGQYTDKIWTDFGIQDERSPNDPTKRNVQPTFILPLGTKVLSLVDGVVTNVEQLYSGDYTVMVAKDVRAEGLIYETEHVINPVVKKGDRVKAGQYIAEVSTHDSKYHPGLGILEIGVMKGGNPPSHYCPFSYLDDSIKEDTFAKIKALYSAWEEYTGKNLYSQESYPVPGCANLEPVKG